MRVAVHATMEWRGVEFSSDFARLSGLTSDFCTYEFEYVLPTYILLRANSGFGTALRLYLTVRCARAVLSRFSPRQRASNGTRVSKLSSRLLNTELSSVEGRAPFTLLCSAPLSPQAISHSHCSLHGRP